VAADDIQSKAADLVKKILTVGVGTIFLTEESLRTLVSEIKLPKEIIAGLLDSAQKTKREFLQNFSNEVLNRFKDKVDPKEFVQEILERNEIEFQIKMKFVPKDGSE